jgi:sensor histidine kinase YesM
MIEIIEKILESSPLGVFSFFMLGVLLVILVQNAFFYYIYRDKTYLIYSLYALIILADQILITFGAYFYTINNESLYSLHSVHPALEWLYNSVYFIFVIQFADLHSINKKVFNIVRNVLFSSILVLLILLFIDTISGSRLTRSGFSFIQVPLLIILSTYVYYYLFKLKTVVKNYIIFGSLIYTVFSILAFSNEFIPNTSPQLGWGFFYIGIFIENIFFTLGLSVKQKMLIKAHSISQEELIVQYQKNAELKNALTEKLQEEVTRQTSEILKLNMKSAEEERRIIQSHFDKEVAELKVSSLQSQMNPHFIFNSLNSIELYIIKNDRDNALYFISKFSKLIRKILFASRHKVVSLQEEIETTELYVNIENIRFKHDINFSVTVFDDISLTNIKIPPLVLQPFIENALWHGLSAKKGKKILSIDVSKKDDNYISITITDNGIGRKKSAEIKKNKLYQKESIGIKLTEERLQFFSKNLKNKHHIKLIDIEKNGKASGTKVIIDLPMR